MRLVCQSNGMRVSLDPHAPLGVGGEARVYALTGDSELCAKIYHHAGESQRRKLAAMFANPPEDPMAALGHISIAWPLDLLHTMYGGEQFAGFLMPRASGMRPVFNVYNPMTRRKETPLFNYLYLHRAGRNVAAAVRALHNRGYVVGDINESNFLVSDTALVTLVDTDSFQVRDPESGRVFRCPVGKPEYTPPELQNRNFRLVDRLPEHDLFGLAVLIFQLLMEGAHPFSGIYEGGGDPPPYQARIQAGHYTYGRQKPPYRPMPFAPPITLLHPGLRDLFARCFEEGHRDPQARPDANAWIAALTAAEEALVTCEANPRHLYGRHLDSCPWCLRMQQLGGRDPFPLQPQEPIKKRPRPVPSTYTPRQPVAARRSVRAAAASATRPSASAAATAALPVGPNLPSWPLAPSAPPPGSPASSAALSLPLSAFGTYHPCTWLAGSMAVVAMILPAFQLLSSSIALVSGIAGWRYTRVGRPLSVLSATIGAIVMSVVLISGVTKSVVKAAVRSISENGPIRSIAFSQDSSLLATATQRNEDQRLIPGQITLYNTTTGDLARSFVGVGDMTAVAFSPDGKTLAAGSGALLEPGIVKLWDMPSFVPRVELSGFQGDVESIAFSPNSRLVATGSRDRTIEVWDAQTGALLNQWRGQDEVFSVAFSPDGSLIASGSGSSGGGLPGHVTVRNAFSGVILWSQKAHGERVMSVAFSPDGKTLASAGDDNILRLWNPQTGRLEAMLEAKDVQALSSVAFSPDGRMAVTGGNDGILRLWDLRKREVVRTFVPDEDERSGQDALVETVAYAPNGRFVAGGAMGGTFHLWRLH